MKTDRELLVEANNLIRSFYQIAKREGRNTNWSVLKDSIERILNEQHSALMKPSKIKFLKK